MKATIFPGGYDPRVLGLPGIEGATFGLEFYPFEEKKPAFQEFDKWAPQGTVRGQVPFIGWLSAEMFIQGLKEAGLNCPTRKAFITNLRLDHSYDGGGAFDPVDLSKGFGQEFPCVVLRQGRERRVRAAVRRQGVLRRADHVQIGALPRDHGRLRMVLFVTGPAKPGGCNCFTIPNVGWTGLSADDIAALACGPFLAACALLAVAGAGKLRRPAHTGRGGARVRVARHAPALRILGATELAIGLAGIVIGGTAAIVVAVAYGAPTVAALLLWRRGAPERRAAASAHPPRPRAVHTSPSTRAAAVAAAVAAFGPRPFTVIADQPLAGVPFLVLVALAAGLAALVADSLPALRATVREGDS